MLINEILEAVQGMSLINFLLVGAILALVLEPIVGYIIFLKKEGWKEPLAREFEEALK